MSMYINKQIQEKIIQEFEAEFAKDIETATVIRKRLAEKYNISYSTTHKITMKNYKLPQAKLEPAKPKKFKSAAQKKPKYKVSTGSTIIFTSWEIRVGVNKEFIDILKQLKNYYSAEIYLTVLWPEDVKFLPPELQEFNILMADLKLNSNIFFKYVPTHVLSASPLAGWSGAHETSVIFPGAIKELQSEKTHKLCKQLMTTGSVGRLNAFLTQYSFIEEEEQRTSFIRRWSLTQARRGGKQYEIAKQFTVPSALVVDIKDSKTFFTRYVTMEKNGVVYDKNLKFTAFSEKPEISRPKALIVGDMHANHIDNDAFNATLQMRDELKPEVIVLQDVWDGSSCNHHEWDDYAKASKFPSLEQETHITQKVLEILTSAEDIKFKYLISNHDNWIIKYLSSEKNYKLGQNYKEAIRLRNWQLENSEHPITELLALKQYKNLEVVEESDNLVISGVVIKHGHENLSGRPGNFKTFQKIYNRFVQGHTHVFGVVKNAVCVGCICKLDAEYTVGSVNAWMHGNAIIQPDGSIQALPIIFGSWKL